MSNISDQFEERAGLTHDISLRDHGYYRAIAAVGSYFKLKTWFWVRAHLKELDRAEEHCLWYLRWKIRACTKVANSCDRMEKKNCCFHSSTTILSCNYLITDLWAFIHRSQDSPQSLSWVHFTRYPGTTPTERWRPTVCDDAKWWLSLRLVNAITGLRLDQPWAWALAIHLWLWQHSGDWGRNKSLYLSSLKTSNVDTHVEYLLQTECNRVCTCDGDLYRVNASELCLIIQGVVYRRLRIYTVQPKPAGTQRGGGIIVFD